jgi:hypothetical protein
MEQTNGVFPHALQRLNRKELSNFMRQSHCSTMQARSLLVDLARETKSDPPQVRRRTQIDLTIRPDESRRSRSCCGSRCAIITCVRDRRSDRNRTESPS